MGLLDRMRSIVARFTREDRYPDRGNPAMGRPAAGVRVTPDTALQSAAVWACHRYLTQTVAQLPRRVMRDNGKFSARVLNHPIVSIFSWRANPELSPFQLVETLTGWALTHGNGVAEIEFDMRGAVAALWPIHPDRVDIRRDAETDKLIYRISNGSAGTVDLRPDQVFHLRGFGNGPVGLSVVEYAAESLGWARATELFGASFFGNGMNTGGVIEGAPTDPDAQKRLLAAAAARHGGPRRAHTPLLLDKAMKWVKSSFAPNESQFIETMQHQVEEVCRWFGVPPHKVAHLLRSTFSNIEHQAIEVVVDSITPWVIRWEEEANYKLFGQNRLGLFVKFDLKGLLRGDFKSRQEGLQIMRRNGAINAEEWRELEDMGPMQAAGSEKYIVEAAMTTLEQVGVVPEPAPKAASPANDPLPPAATLRQAAMQLERGRMLKNAA